MLGDAVSDVRASERLTESAVCIVAPESGMDRQLEKLLANAGRGVAASKPVLEINPAHELIRKLAELGETEIALREDAAQLLLDEALVADGERPRDAKAFAARLGRVIGARRELTFCRPGQAKREPGPIRRVASETTSAAELRRVGGYGSPLSRGTTRRCWNDAEEKLPCPTPR